MVVRAPTTPPGARALLAPDAFKGDGGRPRRGRRHGARAPAGRAGPATCARCPTEARVSPRSSAAVPGPGPGAVAGRSGTETTVTGPLGRPVIGPVVVGRRARPWWSRRPRPGCLWPAGPPGNDPCRATTRGTGELIVAAATAGARRVLVGVGGSATTDGGLGAIEAIEEAGGLGRRRGGRGLRRRDPVRRRRGGLRTPEGSRARPGRRARGPSGGPGATLRATVRGGRDRPPRRRRRRGSGRGPGRLGGRAGAGFRWWPTPWPSSAAWPVPTWSSPGRAASTPRPGLGRSSGSVTDMARTAGVPVLVVAGAVGTGGTHGRRARHGGPDGPIRGRPGPGRSRRLRRGCGRRRPGITEDDRPPARSSA